MPPKLKTPPNPNYKDTATRFKESYNRPLGQFGEGEDTKNQQGIRNPRVVRNFSDEKYLARGERGRKALARREALTYKPGESPAETEQNNSPRNQTQKKEISLIKGSINQNLGRIRSMPIGASILVWSLPYYFAIYLPLAILSTISLGAAWAFGAADTGNTDLASPLLDGSGMGHDAFLVIYFGLTMILIIFTLVQLLVAIFQFKIAFLHPLMGERGTFSKLLFAFLTLINCIIPGANIFPVFFLWLLFAVLNPK